MSFGQGVGDAFARAMIYGEDLVIGLQKLAQQIAATIISTLIEVGIRALITKAMVAAIGGPTASAIPSFDNGGVSTVPGLYYAGVPEAHIPLQNGKVPVELGEKRPAVQVDIINALDPTMLDQYMASARGHDAVVNIMSVRSQSIRRILK